MVRLRSGTGSAAGGKTLGVCVCAAATTTVPSALGNAAAVAHTSCGLVLPTPYRWATHRSSPNETITPANHPSSTGDPWWSKSRHCPQHRSQRTSHRHASRKSPRSLPCSPRPRLSPVGRPRHPHGRRVVLPRPRTERTGHLIPVGRPCEWCLVRAASVPREELIRAGVYWVMRYVDGERGRCGPPWRMFIASKNTKLPPESATIS